MQAAAAELLLDLVEPVEDDVECAPAQPVA
jgi:hypothetical protein